MSPGGGSKPARPAITAVLNCSNNLIATAAQMHFIVLSAAGVGFSCIDSIRWMLRGEGQFKGGVCATAAPPTQDQQKPNPSLSLKKAEQKKNAQGSISAVGRAWDRYWGTETKKIEGERSKKEHPPPLSQSIDRSLVDRENGRRITTMYYHAQRSLTFLRSLRSIHGHGAEIM